MYNCRIRRMPCYMNSNADDPSLYETMCKNCPDNSNYDSNHDDCHCGYDDYSSNVFPDNPIFAQSYVPIQDMTETYLPCVGLQKGTIFPELFNPYNPGQSVAQMNYLSETNVIGKGCNG